MAECDHPLRQWKLSTDRTQVLCGKCGGHVADVRLRTMWGKREVKPDPKPGGKK